MQFTVPQFIEHDPKIFGPLTLKQSIYIGSAIVVIFILYFLVPGLSLVFFVMAAVLFIVIALALSFGQVNGKSLPAVFTNILFFLKGQKIYIWRKKGVSPKFIRRAAIKKDEDGTSTSLKFAERSRLKNLSNQIEINT
jgi:hypothetical protein